MEDTNRNEFEPETEAVEAPEEEIKTTDLPDADAEKAEETEEIPADDAETPVGQDLPDADAEKAEETEEIPSDDAETLAEQDLLDADAEQDSDEAVEDTVTDVLSDAVANGEITAEEAADIRSDVLDAVGSGEEIAVEKPKNKALTITLWTSITVLVLVLAAWGGMTLAKKKANEPWNGLSLKKDYSKYIDLIDYNALTYTNGYAAPTDEQVMEEIHEKMADHSKSEKVTGVIQKGDTARIDYTGFVDGKEFEGGSAKGYDLSIGSGSFIPGFEDGLIGHKAGEKVTLDLKFPDNYRTEDLKGKAVKFEVEIKEVTRVIYEELTDALAEELSQGEQKTAKEYKEAVKQKLDDTAKSDAESAIGNDLWKQIVDGSELKSYPQKMYDYFKETLDKQYSSYYESYKVEDLEGFMKANGMDLDAYIKDQMKYELSIYTIARKEGIEITEDDISTLLKKYNYESKEALLEAQKMKEFELDEYILYSKVTAYLKTAAKEAK